MGLRYLDLLGATKVLYAAQDLLLEHGLATGIVRHPYTHALSPTGSLLKASGVKDELIALYDGTPDSVGLTNTKWLLVHELTNCIEAIINTDENNDIDIETWGDSVYVGDVVKVFEKLINLIQSALD